MNYKENILNKNCKNINEEINNLFLNLNNIIEEKNFEYLDYYLFEISKISFENPEIIFKNLNLIINLYELLNNFNEKELYSYLKILLNSIEILNNLNFFNKNNNLIKLFEFFNYKIKNYKNILFSIFIKIYSLNDLILNFIFLLLFLNIIYNSIQTENEIYSLKFFFIICEESNESQNNLLISFLFKIYNQINNKNSKYILIGSINFLINYLNDFSNILNLIFIYINKLIKNYNLDYINFIYFINELIIKIYNKINEIIINFKDLINLLLLNNNSLSILILNFLILILNLNYFKNNINLFLNNLKFIFKNSNSIIKKNSLICLIEYTYIFNIDNIQQIIQINLLTYSFNIINLFNENEIIYYLKWINYLINYPNLEKGFFNLLKNQINCIEFENLFNKLKIFNNLDLNNYLYLIQSEFEENSI